MASWRWVTLREPPRRMALPCTLETRIGLDLGHPSGAGDRDIRIEAWASSDPSGDLVCRWLQDKFEVNRLRPGDNADCQGGAADSALHAVVSRTMNEGHPNAIAYRRTAEAFRSGDQTELASLIASDVVWHVPGAHSMAGEIRGRDRLLDWLGQLRAKGFWLIEHDVFGNDEHVCALSLMGAQRSGAAVQTAVVRIFHYREGQQLERWFYPDDPADWERIFAEEAEG